MQRLSHERRKARRKKRVGRPDRARVGPCAPAAAARAPWWPPSSYDRSSFCRVLRTGIDPASIIVGRIMPVYEIDDVQCSRLFRFLTEGA